MLPGRDSSPAVSPVAPNPPLAAVACGTGHYVSSTEAQGASLAVISTAGVWKSVIGTAVTVACCHRVSVVKMRDTKAGALRTLQ